MSMKKTGSSFCDINDDPSVLSDYGRELPWVMFSLVLYHGRDLELEVINFVIRVNKFRVG